MERAQSTIERAGRGIVIWLDQEAKGNGHLALIRSTEYKLRGFSQSEGYKMAGYVEDARDYRPAAAIINELQIKSIVLLSGVASKAEKLRAESINISKTVPLS
jgi:GTP cyclohydrolase II